MDGVGHPQVSVLLFKTLSHSRLILLTGVTNHVDDEYRWAGVEDPKVMITTSRDPSSRLKMFAKVPAVGVSGRHPGTGPGPNQSACAGAEVGVPRRPAHEPWPP